MKKLLLMTLVIVSSLALPYTFYLVSHGGPADPFWGVVMKGLKDAGRDFGVNVVYLGLRSSRSRNS